ncbi:S-layer homology domain-containing protein [Chamaesiphon sp.]|uniref:S-layer homology domain-containing protein n=1 Tax=Chamaesiphon sp. TaxID=2814140 RepID=UPI0035940345
MTNSPPPTPNPNRRRRLTADELIAIGVALAGIGTVFFWGIGQKYQPMFERSIASLGGDNTINRQTGAIGGKTGSNEPGRQPIESIARDRQNPAPTTIVSPPPTIQTEVPAAPVQTAPGVTTPAIVPVPVPIATTPVFTDVPQQFWGATYITELRKRGILDDFGSDRFDPSKQITRGEYAKMLDRAFADRPTTATAVNFNDIPADYPRKEAVDKSVQLGFMAGYSPTKFAPNQSIPRYQLQISLAKGLQLPIPTSAEQVLSKFPDAAQMPTYAREKMAAAVDSGLTIKDGTADRLKPAQNATRADAAALIYEALVKEGKIKN